MFYQWTDTVGVDVSYEGKDETGGVAETFLIHFHDTRIADIFEIGRIDAHRTRIVVVNGFRQRVAEGNHRIQFQVLQLRFHTVFEGSVSFFVHARSSEAEVDQFEQGLQVGRGGGAVHIFAVQSQGSGAGYFLSGQHLAQIGSREIAQAAQFDYLIEHFQIVDVFVAEQCASSRAGSRHLYFILFKVRVFQHDFDAVAQCQDGSAEERIFLAFRDLAGCRQ